jgi:hypothetical protein
MEKSWSLPSILLKEKLKEDFIILTYPSDFKIPGQK